MGTANHFLSNLANAYANYSRAYQLTLLFPQFNLTAAQITYNLGMACRLLNRPKEAISLLSEAEAFFRNASDVKRLAQSLFELGIAYRYGRNLERANSCLQESLALYRSINIFNMANLVKESYAFSVMSNHNMEEAVEELLKCAKWFEMDGNLMNVAFTYARISYILLQKKNVESAIDFIDQALELFNEEKDLNNPRYAYVFRV
ncbi:MAG: tetratricopeptide repeat protein, partial [Tumebacillaceae bacterium]